VEEEEVEAEVSIEEKKVKRVKDMNNKIIIEVREDTNIQNQRLIQTVLLLFNKKENNPEEVAVEAEVEEATEVAEEMEKEEAAEEELKVEAIDHGLLRNTEIWEK